MNPCQGLSLIKLLKYIALDADLAKEIKREEMCSKELRSLAAGFFFKFSQSRGRFQLKKVQGVDTLFCLACTDQVANHQCMGCLRLKEIVDKAFHSDTNVREGKCRGPMVKAFHSHLALQSTTFGHCANDVMEKLIRDAVKSTFDKERFGRLKDKCRSRVMFSGWIHKGGDAANVVLLSYLRAARSCRS